MLNQTLNKTASRRIMKLSGLAFIITGVLFINAQLASAQAKYPDTLKVPVTFYDFRSNGSNPEFEITPSPGARHYNMVNPTLNGSPGPGSKPSIGSTPYWNCYIAKWFVPWTPDNKIPNYRNHSVTDCRYGDTTIASDRAFENIRFLDTLRFWLTDSILGTYGFDSANFFPLGTRGFGYEGNTHNYSFTMELHWKFTMVSGLKFIFRGDDDVWAFINGTLVMDIGGIHSWIRDTIILDDIKGALGLVDGQDYYLDFFYVERHVTGSTIQITSNIIAAKPSNIGMTVSPDTNVLSAGDSITYNALITDQSNNVIHDYDDSLKWTYATVPTGGYSILRKTNGIATTFVAQDAYYTYYIKAILDVPSKIPGGPTIHLEWKDTIYVKPGPPTSLFIEANAESTVSLQNPARMGSTTMSSTMSKDSVYAVLRDKFGNWFSHALLASWLSRDTTVVTVAPGRTQLGEGVLTRQTADTATRYIRASQLVNSVTLSDSLRVIITNVTYGRIQIYVISGGSTKNIDTLRMRTDQDTTLRARGQWTSDTSRWDDVAVDWYKSPNLILNNTPGNSRTWNFNPIDTGTGIIYINFTSASVLRDTIKAIFTVGPPFREALYPLPGQPNTTTNAPLPGSVTIQAGTPYQIVAKLFTDKNLWLSEYEKTTASFTWTVTEVVGSGNTGSLSTSAGYLTVFTPTRAYNSVRITATFRSAGVPDLTQSILISVTPGPPDHLVIEGDTSKLTSPNKDNPIGTITIGQRDTCDTAYAILRDVYQNWCGYSQWTDWKSVDTNRVTASSGNAGIGAGIIKRVSAGGQTYVIAKDLDTAQHKGPKFIDTVLVILSGISYDSLRVVVRDSIRIDSLTMQIDQDTLIQVQGKRSDTGLWEAVPADWWISADRLASSTPPKGVNSWEFGPSDTGTGYIVVSKGGSVSDTIKFHFIPGPPYSIVLYPLPGKPGIDNMPLPSPGDSIIDTAGKALQLVAKIFDIKGNWLNSYESSGAPILWTVRELTGNPPTGSLSDVIGYLTAFKPLRAFNSVYIVATFDTAGYKKCSDSVRVVVVHGKPAQLVIEENQNWQASPNSPRPVGRIQIDSTEMYRYVYAMIRDSLGNFVDYSEITIWSSLDEKVVTAQEGLASIGQGIIKRVTSGDSTYVVATSGEYPGLSGRVQVIVLKYFYRELRIVVRTSVRIENLTMSTNDDTTLCVEGLRSDTTLWEPISARWENSQGLIIDPTAPERSNCWRFSPVSPADSGWIRVTVGNDAQTKPDTVSVKFERGAPTKIDITLLTPPDKRIAGDTIIGLVRIYNKDGLVPGVLCDTTVLQESLGKGNTNQNPVTIVDDSTYNLNKAPSSLVESRECFNFGLDTVKFVLYNATIGKDTSQRLYVNLDSLSASTDPFDVLPAELNSVAIQDYSGKNLDSVHLNFPNGSQVFFVVGYDRFGNKVVLSDGATWTTTDQLHPIDRSMNVNRIYYDVIQVKRDESGFIYASVLDSSGKKIEDRVRVTIAGPLTNLVAAVTGDADGDGYLDKIVLHFDKEATIPSSMMKTGDSIVITYTDVNGVEHTFIADSVRGMSGSGLIDTVFTVYFAENQTSMPQTAWTPSITINGGLNGVGIINGFAASDGAGPVLWKVIKDNKSVTTNIDDQITVVFSEPIQASDGSEFKTGVPPSLVFYIWAKDSLGNFIRLDSIQFIKNASGNYIPDTLHPLEHIITFTGPPVTNSQYTTVTFTMTNGYDITALDFFSIRIDSSEITDKSKNLNHPAQNNHLVRVEVISNIPEKLVVGPNPSRPTFNRERPGELHFKHNQNARTWIYTDHAATVINFMVDVILDPNLKISGYLKIYDVVGNPVQYAVSDDILKETGWQSGSGIHNFDIYWNQSNSRGMKVAPGNYFAVAHLTINKTNSSETKKYTATVGVSR